MALGPHLGPRLDLRQNQSLVMTPQLQQAIRLLALSNLELEAAIAEAVADNPLIDLVRDESEERRTAPAEQLLHEAVPDMVAGEAGDGAGDGGGEAALDIAPEMIDRDFDTGGNRPTGGGDGSEGFDPADRATDSASSLADYLHAQVGTAGGTAGQQFVAHQLIDCLDEAGYLAVPIDEIAASLGLAPEDVEAALDLVQSLDPTGVGARDLAECIALQAKEADRYDPCMQALIAHLDLVARGDFAQLRRLCRVDDDDLADMIAELRGYDPKPGCRIGGEPAPPVVPDVLVRAQASGGWRIALNRDTMPRLLIDRDYVATLKAGCAKDRASRGWLGEKLADANWLIKALDQRQTTIVKVASEIVRRQEGFFLRGVSALVPLTLRDVAEAVSLHESTVSRVTSNKFLHCPRGTFEMKYFFSSGVAKSGPDGGDGASAEAVKAAIRTLIDAEEPNAVLSDDTLVDLLHDKGFTLARRTVAKYREAIGLGSSVQRRRQRKLSGKR